VSLFFFANLNWVGITGSEMRKVPQNTPTHTTKCEGWQSVNFALKEVSPSNEYQSKQKSHSKVELLLNWILKKEF
jgi:hypothetical protein